MVGRSARVDQRRGVGLDRRRLPAARDSPDAASRPLSRPQPARPSGGLPALTPQIGLFGSAIAFVGAPSLLSHPLRATLVRRPGEVPFHGIYSLVAIVYFVAVISFLRVVVPRPHVGWPGRG